MRQKTIHYSFVLVAVLCIFGAGCSIPGLTLNGRFTEEQDFTFAATGIASIHAETANGAIVLSATEIPEIKIHAVKTIKATTDEKAKEYAAEVVLKAEQEGDVLKVYYTQPKGWKQVQIDVSYTIQCPPALDLTIQTTNGNIEMLGPDKTVDANTTNGSIILTGGRGTLSLHTTNGNVKVEKATGKIEASTTNGNVSVDMDVLEENADLSTTNGGVHIHVGKGGAPIRAGSTNGSISVSLPADFNGQLDASTWNGSISSDFPVSMDKPSKTKLKGAIGQGGNSAIILHTTNGGVSIKKSQ